MNNQLEKLRTLSLMPSFANNPDTPIAKTINKILRRKPTKSAASRRVVRTPTPRRLSIEKSKRNKRNKSKRKTSRKNTV